MSLRFTFRPPRIRASEKSDPPLSLSKKQIEAMSKTTPEDIKDARAWLDRMGMDQVASMLDAK